MSAVLPPFDTKESFVDSAWENQEVKKLGSSKYKKKKFVQNFENGKKQKN